MAMSNGTKVSTSLNGPVRDVDWYRQLWWKTASTNFDLMFYGATSECFVGFYATMFQENFRCPAVDLMEGRNFKRKIETYWLAPNRAHDVIGIKLNYTPSVRPTEMTAWHYCRSNRTPFGGFAPIMYEFGMVDRQDNPINIVPGAMREQYLIEMLL
ncbi:2651_t:CDS:2 [Paraglomus occultum]|uniref:2651_t:CDS:1 n=1 Tax=Paraglomus occultum TaxID=144539 RepID=A0A9N9ABY0_9GLOM|nr:2651_t:CDS:2 [Paraglomus occultum]